MGVTDLLRSTTFDTQEVGHQWLAQKGYTSVWGVGRHILGSQSFDYWWDTIPDWVWAVVLEDGDGISVKNDKSGIFENRVGYETQS
ncbi:hypothetical protein ASPACDRAFT_45077 [Aspergillus aculeatus ATCC 16872]|uniref:Uncharacterized protein n=1 Tax=Aspergillus aculeatus (strain ATCC 16872 / CBS 172.66 / WB 5094) TaxID=690307 RepID=A0A1L9WQW1_ASPA1|nr:uncharacterized protein ASPACDRAFT_45077 [Aspergillus aculeatus ATCC 16872]OJJ98569.1 hypothetical protein ASPACDRAFT_45077 [Aspergillus aculeatus ATCC 16872]